MKATSVIVDQAGCGQILDVKTSHYLTPSPAADNCPMRDKPPNPWKPLIGCLPLLPWVFIPVFWIFLTLDAEWQQIVGMTAGGIAGSVVIFCVVKRVNRRV